MKEYPDPREYTREAAARYIDGLQQMGIELNQTLIKALAERTGEEYEQELVATLLHNLDVIEKDSRRNFWRQAWSLPVGCVLALITAGYSFTHVLYGVLMGISSLVLALVFAALFAFEFTTVFDWPKRRRGGKR